MNLNPISVKFSGFIVNKVSNSIDNASTMWVEPKDDAGGNDKSQPLFPDQMGAFGHWITLENNGNVKIGSHMHPTKPTYMDATLPQIKALWDRLTQGVSVHTTHGKPDCDVLVLPNMSRLMEKDVPYTMRPDVFLTRMKTILDVRTAQQAATPPTTTP